MIHILETIEQPPRETILYKGKPIQELTREELIEALTNAVNQIEQLRNSYQHEREMLKGN
jgi:hypothetical protein